MSRGWINLRIQGFFTSRECEFTDNLINAYRDADQEKWNKNANSVISGSVFPAIVPHY